MDMPTIGICDQDDSLGPDSPLMLDPTGATMGFVCPENDQDWYAFDVPAGDALVAVTLQVGTGGIRSPVDATYSIVRADAVDEAVATPDGEAVGPGARLEDTHCIGAGSYLLSVRDQGDDAEDLRNPYTLTVSTSAELDGAEPNDTTETATALNVGGMAAEGYVSCVGDVDLYSFTVAGDDASARVRLSTPGDTSSGECVGCLSFIPSLRLLESDGTTLVLEGFGSRAQSQATETTLIRQLEPGTYFVEVAASDGRGADPAIPYELSVALTNDPDPNEPNDDSLEATPLGPVVCGAEWSTFLEATGALVAPADNDWFAVTVPAGCAGAIVEATVELLPDGLTVDEQWALQREVQASLTMVRPVPGVACADDDTCTTLASRTCEIPDDPEDTSGQVDCWGVGACQRDGFCAGARECFPTGVCGANQVTRSYFPQSAPPMPTEGPENRAMISAPILTGGTFYLRVSDFQSNGGDPRAQYRLRVRTHGEPDAYEPDNLYLANPIVREPAETGPSFTIRDARVGGDGGCTNGTLVDAHVGYEGDVDYFSAPNPCAGVSDCQLRLFYEVDTGPVVPLVRVRARGAETQRDLAPGSGGIIGELGTAVDAGNCFLAPTESDTVDVEIFHFPDGDVTNQEFDPDQRVRFCLDVITDVCQEPCVLIDGTCFVRN
ncbi:MAG: hypothetical protein AAGH15_05540 [Myxococcota bacterium]